MVWDVVKNQLIAHLREDFLKEGPFHDHNSHGGFLQKDGDEHQEKKKAIRVVSFGTSAPETPFPFFCRIEEERKIFFKTPNSAKTTVLAGCLDEIVSPRLDEPFLKKLQVALDESPKPYFSFLAFSPSEKRDLLWSNFPLVLLILARFTFTYRPEGLEISFCYRERELLSFLEILITDFFSGLKKEPGFKKENRLKSLLIPERDASLGRSIDKALSLLNEGRLQKVVIAGYEDYLLEGPSESYLQKLLSVHQNTYQMIAHYGGRILFSFSPEKLLAVEQGIFSSESLAGTISSQEDSVQLYKPKLLEENRIVKDFLLDVFQKHCEAVEISDREVVSLPNVKHLRYRVSGKIKGRYLPLVLDMYPTPALSGFPKELAVRYVDKIEPFKRHFYGGLFGTLGRESCHLAVGIRMGVLWEDKLRLFAGAGLTRDSVKEEEMKEIKDKLSFGLL